ncbi:hypothetical protein [Streptomyces sp. Isolate_45]|uniref:hypothetical protein n=1 Tax=Streptomyces sp. Isolate_45 TaxID=2950111 RepID=UPI0024819A85|nr:hypothetical protein [Streptomyces sp. Isolate_45]MDA5283136.1 hypothetical protein [Streptomyces sp. Isolate_45]
MSTAPASEPQSPQPETEARPAKPEAKPTPAKPKPRLVFDDPLDQQSSDDTDRGWGERAPAGGGTADLARFLDEKPPHHI